MLGFYMTIVIGLPMLFINDFGNIKVMAKIPSSTLVSVIGKQGEIIGTTITEGGVFKGIPFSQPPTGQYRWKKPRDPVPFPGKVWYATRFRPACIQKCSGQGIFPCPTTNENCLYLNVWVPTSVLEETHKSDSVIKGKHHVVSKKYKNKESLAVMLFIHGGTFLNGAGSLKLYDGRFMASQGNVIIVTTNYRLGALGFLVQSSGGVHGNYGIYDQIAALKWIQQNIAYFGGNPNKVTIFGESAGAESVGTLLVSDAAKGLFHQAIMESNPFALPFRNTANADKYGNTFAGKLGCKADDMACLRAVTPDAILDAMSKMPKFNLFGKQRSLAFQPWSPVIDGTFLKELPLFAFMKGRAMKMPIIFGTTQDEGLLFIPFIFKKPVSDVKYYVSLIAVFGLFKAYAVEHEYPSEKDNRYTLGKIITDFAFKCPNRAAAFGTTSQTWFYLFNQPAPELFASGLCHDKVCHSAELPFVFETMKLIGNKYTLADQLLAERMIRYWTNFAKYGNPNGQTGSTHKRVSNYAISWPEFSPNGDHSNYKSIKFEAKGDTIITNEEKNICNFWDGLALYGKVK